LVPNWFRHIDLSSVGIAVTWTLFMSFFTYTCCWVALVSTKVPFLNVYSNSQASTISLIVNFGLVLMLVFDYMKSTATLEKWMFGLFGASMLVAVTVYAHSLAMTENHLGDFIMPISHPFFGVVLHLLFLTLLCVMKFVCLSKESGNTINLRSI